MAKSKITKQMDFWGGESGNAYVDRNPMNIQESDTLYLKDYGITRRDLNERFLGNLNRDLKILEVGSNIGLQLELFRLMGFKNLLGIELNDYAVEKAKQLHPKVDVIRGSAFDLPFRDGYFDLVYTSGVLIHINPKKDLLEVSDEIYRVTNRYIWCYEFAAREPIAMTYRDRQELFWKQDFLKFYLNRFSNLKVMKAEELPVLNSENFTQMFLLEKK